MPYSTLTDIQDIIKEQFLIQLTDDENTGSVDTAKTDKAIADADELIDGYLRGRYTLPLSPVPGLIRKLSVDIAIFNLYSRRPEGDSTPELITDRFKSAVDTLKQIQKGVVSLGVAGDETPEPGAYETNKTDDDRVFDKDLLDKF